MPNTPTRLYRLPTEDDDPNIPLVMEHLGLDVDMDVNNIAIRVGALELDPDQGNGSSETGLMVRDLVAGFETVQGQVDDIVADPSNAVTQFYVPARTFDVVQGAATYGAITSRMGGWPLTFNADTYLAAAVRLPSHWTAMAVDILWVNTVANAGNVSWTVASHQWTVGESIHVTPAGLAALAAANPAPWIATTTTLGTPETPITVDPARFLTLRLQRNGASGTDTLDASAAVLGVILRKLA